jgi:pimeloyl-ACP methyl ester carboxylesterase
MIKFIHTVSTILLFSTSLLGQGIELPYKSKIADLGDIKLQYMDFGGHGPTLIWIQDFHNYFEGVYQDSSYSTFFKDLSKEFRVIAPIRRGYGQSTDTRWGYDVATQAKDLLHFMDALAIKRAVFMVVHLQRRI